MPTYVYQCSKCSNNYEKKEGFDAPPRQKCPKCGGKAQRVILAPPIVFKGSGFYKTDSRKAPAESESSPASDGKPSDGASSKGSSSDGASPDKSSKDAEPAAASSD